MRTRGYGIESGPDMIEFVPEYKVINSPVIHISDLHIPYTAYDVIDSLIELYGSSSEDKSVLVIGGDILDNEHISVYGHKTLESYLEIIMEANSLVRKLSEYFEVIVLDGNHDRWLGKSMHNQFSNIGLMLPQTMNYYITKDIYFDYDEEMFVITAELPHVHYYGQRFFKVGNVLFMHPSNYRSAPGATVRGAIETAMEEDIDFDIMVIGHTHSMQQIVHFRKVGIESGSMSYNRKYIVKSGRFSKAAYIGYTVLNFSEGFCVDYYLHNITMQNKLLRRLVGQQDDSLVDEEQL